MIYFPYFHKFSEDPNANLLIDLYISFLKRSMSDKFDGKHRLILRINIKQGVSSVKLILSRQVLLILNNCIMPSRNSFLFIEGFSAVLRNILVK